MAFQKLLTLILLLPWCSGPTLGEIGNDFSKCLQFFYNETPPMGFSASEYQPICQRYKNNYRFATLYNRNHRAAMYSAYILKIPKDNYPNGRWMCEPQLANPNARAEMQPFNHLTQMVKESQALNTDYTNSGYTRGHLAPRAHQETQEESDATFTLTNIVPQTDKSNNKYWCQLETRLKNIKSSCKGSMYVITGTIPYKPEEKKLINNRVYVPEYLWSAYCCPSYSPNMSNSSEIHFPTYAAVGRNDPNSGSEFVDKSKETENYGVKEMSLANLEEILKERLKMKITLFKGQCRVMVNDFVLR